MYPADICVEVFANTFDDAIPYNLANVWKAHGDPFSRYTGALVAMSPLVPAGALLGLPFATACLATKHLVEPMANGGVRAAGRRLDFVHMANRNDDVYFAPLRDLEIRDAMLYMGLVRYGDGKAGALQRLATFRKHYGRPFGVATECGLSRIPERWDLAGLLRLQREVALAAQESKIGA